MARITLGPNVTDIRGSIGNVVYSIWKAGLHYIRSKPAIISNPKSADQVAIRQIVAQSSARWFSALNEAQRASWEEMAQRLRTLAGGGNGQGGILNMIPPVGGIMSGINAYVSLRAAAFTAGLDPLLFSDTAPLGEDQPANVIEFSAAWDNIAAINIGFFPPIPVLPGARVRLWLRSRELVYHRQLVISADADDAFASILGAKGSLGVTIPFQSALPQQILLQVDVINLSGFRSFSSETIEVKIFA